MTDEPFTGSLEINKLFHLKPKIMKKLLIIPSVILVISIITQTFLSRIAKTPEGYSLCIVSILFSVVVLILLLSALLYEVMNEKLRKEKSPQ